MYPLYDELVPWYRLLDPTEDHEPEANVYRELLTGAIDDGRADTLLELGAGAGNNAYFLRRTFTCVLTDVSEPMLALSRAINPACEHLVGDMRSLRLERSFDAVLIHDAVSYMATEDDLFAAAATAFAHTRPGGAALLAPDAVRESFAERTELHQRDDGARALRCVEWWWDPNPTDDQCFADFAFLLRDGADMRAVHDRHLYGLFSTATWLDAMTAAGFAAEHHELDLGEGYYGHGFLGRRPG